MSDTLIDVLDLNQADLEDLLKLPSVNSSLAEKIIAGRPYQSIQDLRRVNGIGKATMQRLQPFLMVSSPPVEQIVTPPEQETFTPPAAEAPPAEPEAGAEEEVKPSPVFAGEDSQTLEPPFLEVQPAPEERKQPETPAAPVEEASPPKENRSWLAILTGDPNKAALWGIAVALLMLFLSLLFNLAVLAAINGGIRYGSANRMAYLEQRFSVLDGDVKNLQQEAASLRARLDSMEALSGRIDALEKESAALRTQSDQLSGQVDDLNTRLEEASSQLNQLGRRVAVFDRFLEGLRALLAEPSVVQP
ncbi:MAG: helix-hairpin-helix domain-containing protein [Anaerolineaceae bacterium]|nr:helix-hairpin-helix domain-containing protein [Anaerolineaceae bacterium]